MEFIKLVADFTRTVIVVWYFWELLRLTRIIASNALDKQEQVISAFVRLEHIMTRQLEKIESMGESGD